LKRQKISAARGNSASRPARGAWIETGDEAEGAEVVGSRPARGAWIETRSAREGPNQRGVAPRAGRVD